MKRPGMNTESGTLIFLVAVMAGLVLEHSAGATISGTPRDSAQVQSSGPVSFIFDDNRVFVELQFIRPDGSVHNALAFVDLGTPAPAVSPELFRELQLDQKRPLEFRLGQMLI